MKTQDGLLTFKGVNCYKTYEKMKIYIRHSVIYISTVKEALTKFASWFRKVFSHMNTWMTEKEFMKLY